MSILKKLLTIQSELKAPKEKNNDFGKYKYRSCEDILEAVKPLLTKTQTVLTIHDSIELVGERYYIKATAILKDTETAESETTTAYAREDEQKKGMDLSQVTGSSSSYARKYALNGLFAIDDNKDSDATNETVKETAKPQPTKQPDKPTAAPANTPKIAETSKPVVKQPPTPTPAPVTQPQKPPQEQPKTIVEPTAPKPQQNPFVGQPATPTLICEDCTLPVEGYTTSNGVSHTAQELFDGTKITHGRHLCLACAQKAMREQKAKAK